MNMRGLLSSVRIAHITRYWKFLLLHYVQFLCQCRVCKADHAYFKYVDGFTNRYLETGVYLSAYCIATAVLVHFEIFAQQRVYTPKYGEERICRCMTNSVLEYVTWLKERSGQWERLQWLLDWSLQRKATNLRINYVRRRRTRLWSAHTLATSHAVQWRVCRSRAVLTLKSWGGRGRWSCKDNDCYIVFKPTVRGTEVW
jgi:hypothetical protein